MEATMTVRGYRNVTTRGTYLGEEGTGYAFGELAEHGDFSAATGGHLQGFTEPVMFRVLIPGARVGWSRGGECLLFPAEGEAFATEYGPLPQGVGVPAGLAISYGLVELVEEG